MDPIGLLVGGLALMAGGVLKGATGAGTPILAVPLLALLYDVPFAIAVFAMPNVVTNLWQSWSFRAHHPSVTLSRRFSLTGAAGTVLGTVLLVSLPTQALLLVVALAVFLYIGFRLARPDWALPLALAERIAVPVGAASGTLQGAAGISAPISVTYLNAIRMERAGFIATISTYFATVGLVQVPLLVGFGVMTAERFWLSILAIAPVLAGMPLGAWLVRFVSRETFDRLILAILFLVAVRLAWGALL